MARMVAGRGPAIFDREFDEAAEDGIFEVDMATLIFIIAVLSFLFLAAKIVLHWVAGKDIVILLRMTLLMVAGYALLWLAFFLLRTDREQPLGVDHCFDDWCAMVTGAEYPETLGRPDHPVRPRGQWLLLYVRLSNPLRAAQRRETQPRVLVIDPAGRAYEPSDRGQKALEESSGEQTPFVNQPGLQRSFETELVFDVPKDAKTLRVRIDNGPSLLRSLMLPEGRLVTVLP
jgi:hypothetical protein